MGRADLFSEDAAPSSAAEQERGLIHGQESLPYANERFGWGCYGKNGCTLIAVYNALQLLEKPRSLGEICRRFRQKHRLLAFGAWGASPWSMGAFFREAGIPARGYWSSRRLTDNLREGDVICFTVMNTHNPFQGFHTMTARRSGDCFEVFNVGPHDKFCRRCLRLEDAFPGGVWIYGYRVGNGGMDSQSRRATVG